MPENNINVVPNTMPVIKAHIENNIIPIKINILTGPTILVANIIPYVIENPSIIPVIIYIPNPKHKLQVELMALYKNNLPIFTL